MSDVKITSEFYCSPLIIIIHFNNVKRIRLALRLVQIEMGEIERTVLLLIVCYFTVCCTKPFAQSVSAVLSVISSVHVLTHMVCLFILNVSLFHQLVFITLGLAPKGNAEVLGRTPSQYQYHGFIYAIGHILGCHNFCMNVLYSNSIKGFLGELYFNCHSLLKSVPHNVMSSYLNT